jgi:hypothetical protein
MLLRNRLAQPAQPACRPLLPAILLPAWFTPTLRERHQRCHRARRAAAQMCSGAPNDQAHRCCWGLQERSDQSTGRQPSLRASLSSVHHRQPPLLLTAAVPKARGTAAQMCSGARSDHAHRCWGLQERSDPSPQAAIGYCCGWGLRYRATQNYQLVSSAQIKCLRRAARLPFLQRGLWPTSAASFTQPPWQQRPAGRRRGRLQRGQRQAAERPKATRRVGHSGAALTSEAPTTAPQLSSS